jgi:serine/threonine-protein kinase
VPQPDERTDASYALRDIAAFLHPSDDPRMLGRVGAYEILGVVGMGGMGIVLKGFDVALNRYVAIKVLSPHLASSAAARNRFAREAQAAAAVVHDHVVPIHGVAEHNGLPYLVMPYIRGESLQRRLDRTAPLATIEAVRIAKQCASALAAAHEQGLVHRDIKPANILLDEGVERVRITDFGLARAVDDASLTRSGVVAGTPQYMSPEQASGEPLDHRSDLFSLGSVLYVMLTGRLPFRAETSLAILRRITDATPRPIRQTNPEVPEWLEALVQRLHEKRPEQRFQSAQDVENALTQCMQHLQDPRKPLPPDLLQAATATRSRHTQRLSQKLAGIALTGMILLVAIGWWQFRLPRNERLPQDTLPTEASLTDTPRMESPQEIAPPKPAAAEQLGSSQASAIEPPDPDSDVALPDSAERTVDLSSALLDEQIDAPIDDPIDIPIDDQLRDLRQRMNQLREEVIETTLAPN